MQHSRGSQARKSELTVIIKAKDLCKYIVTITLKSPKHFRYTFTARLQNLSMDVIEHMYRANSVFVPNNEQKYNKYMVRLELQRKAMADLNMLAFFAHMSFEQEAILAKQFEHISKLANECMSLLGAWMKSDRDRFDKNI